MGKGSCKFALLFLLCLQSYKKVSIVAYFFLTKINVCLDNATIYILGKKINMILLHSIDILVTDMEEITTIRQGGTPQVMLGIKKNTQKIKASFELSGEDCFKYRVLLQTTAWQSLIFRRKICFLLLAWITAKPSMTDVDNTKLHLAEILIIKKHYD